MKVYMEKIVWAIAFVIMLQLGLGVSIQAQEDDVKIQNETTQDTEAGSVNGTEQETNQESTTALSQEVISTLQNETDGKQPIQTTQIIQKETTKNSTQKETKKITVSKFSTQIDLYKGEKRIIKPSKKKITLTSSNQKVISVSKKGTVKANRCGKSVITITIKNKNRITEIKVTASVKMYSLLDADEVKKKDAKAKKTLKKCGLSIKSDSKLKNEINITQKEINAYFSKSAFIGNSIGVGLRMYFNSKGYGFLGNPLMLVRGCYSFANDKGGNSEFRLQYHGKTMQAKDAVAQSGVKRVFINMGTNDLYLGVDGTFREYINYVTGIKKKNPDVMIFIQSMTPIYRSTKMTNLNNNSVNRLNELLKKYCEGKKDIYYIDINSVLKDSAGGLRGDYCSDKYVHMTMKGYEVWTNQVVKEVKKILEEEQLVKDAVKTATESRLKSDKKVADKMLKKLKNSTLKKELKNKLKTKKYH